MNDPLQLVGVPYRREGNNVGEGFDCFTLVRFVRAEFYQRLTPLTQPSTTLPAESACMLGFHHATRGNGALWYRCAPQEGCVIGLARYSFGRLHHCGVLVRGGVLHAMQDAGVMFTPFGRIRECYMQVEAFECRS